MTEKEWVRLGGKDGIYLVEGEDYTVDREAGLLTINENAWAKVPARCSEGGTPRKSSPLPASSSSAPSVHALSRPR